MERSCQFERERNKEMVVGGGVSEEREGNTDDSQVFELGY